MWKLVLEILASITAYLSNGRLIDAGKAQAELEAKNEAEKDIAVAEDIRASDNIDFGFLFAPKDRDKK